MAIPVAGHLIETHCSATGNASLFDTNVAVYADDGAFPKSNASPRA